MLTSYPLVPPTTLSDTNPAALGTAAPGVGTSVSRADHVHPASLSDANPAAVGTAAPGVATSWSRADHVHPHSLSDNSPEQLGTAASGVSTSGSRSDHVHPGPWSKAVSPTTVQTTDATETTLLTIPSVTNKGHSIDLKVSATRDDRSAQYDWQVRATVTNNGGTCAIRDKVIAPIDGGASGLVVDLDLSGTSIRVRVTGNADPYDWVGAGSYLIHGS